MYHMQKLALVDQAAGSFHFLPDQLDGLAGFLDGSNGQIVLALQALNEVLQLVVVAAQIGDIALGATGGDHFQLLQLEGEVACMTGVELVINMLVWYMKTIGL